MWHNDGTPAYKFYYRDGNKVGVWKFYDESGNLIGGKEYDPIYKRNAVIIYIFFILY